MSAIEVITNRVSPAQLTEPGPTREQLQAILAAGTRAPDHGKMQPWRFLLIEGEARQRFGEVMAQSLKRREPEAPQGKLDAERKKPLRAPLVIVVSATVRENPKVPDVEQVVAAGAAAQNMMLAAHAVGLGAFWRTGPAAYDPELKRELGIAESDAIVGFIYLGSIGIAGPAKAGDVAAVTRRW